MSQYDYGSRTLEISLFNGASPFNIPEGANVVIQGTKKDRTGFQYEHLDFENNVVYADITQQMTVFEDEVLTELVISLVDENDESNNEQLATANFLLVVEEAALKDDIVVSETDIPAIQDLPEAMAEVRAAVISTAAAAESANANAIKSQSYAEGGTGTRTGEDTDNAKYYKEQAGIYATATENIKNDSEAWSVGTKGGVPVTQGDPQYHNNSKYHAEQAASSETNAAISETNASTSESNANRDALKAEGYAVGKQNGADVSSDSEYWENNALFYANRASEDAITASDAATAATGAVDQINTALHQVVFTVDFTTGELNYDDDIPYTFSVNSTTGNLEWEVVV